MTSFKNAAERGEEIYARLYKTEYEEKYPGLFVAIDVQSERAFVGDSPEDALTKARSDLSDGTFHLIQVGSPGVYRVGYASGGDDGDWLFGGQ